MQTKKIKIIQRPISESVSYLKNDNKKLIDYCQILNTIEYIKSKNLDIETSKNLWLFTNYTLLDKPLFRSVANYIHDILDDIEDDQSKSDFFQQCLIGEYLLQSI